jgi:hypothetical protein
MPIWAACSPCPITSNCSVNPARDASVETGLTGRTGGKSRDAHASELSLSCG